MTEQKYAVGDITVWKRVTRFSPSYVYWNDSGWKFQAPLDWVGDVVPAPEQATPYVKSCHRCGREHWCAGGLCADCEIILERERAPKSIEQPKLIPCADCRAPLRTEQVKRDGLCAYCATRIDFIGHATCAELASRYGSLDDKIAMAQSATDKPRHPADWDVDMVEYEL